MFGDKSLIGRGLDVLARLFGVSTPSGTARPRRIVIVSNRLPFNVRDDHGLLRYEESAGGLVTGISAYLESLPGRSAPPRSYQWVGWPGGTVDSSARAAVIAEARTRYQSHPVFLSFEEMEQFYHGFCNKTIWPLFHYFPTYAIYREEFWREYQKVNELFCDALLQIIREDDVVWIHDYHLMLLPAMVKAKVPAIPVGFFLHIPFPSFEVFRLLPGRWRRQLLEGMLGADLIGFHTYEYSQHFLQSVLRIVGHEHNLGYISLPTRVVRVETFPMGIDFQKFWSAVDLPEVQEERMALRKSLAASKVILSVDRLDYTKGIIDRLQGFETLLETQPKYREKVVLAMIVVPSRVAVEQYEMMKKQIEELVGKINGRFGSVHWTPVIYQYRAVPFRSLVAMYNASDIALVTPLRDGMNLVAKEYIATRIDQSGVLVLSEMAGAAKELSEAIVINPGNREEIAGALEEALEMPIEEQKRRNAIMQARLRRYTVLRWADDFIERLIELREVQVNLLAKLLPADDRRTMLNEYRNARHRLFLLDYDGTLVPLPNARIWPGLMKNCSTCCGILRWSPGIPLSW